MTRVRGLAAAVPMAVAVLLGVAGCGSVAAGSPTAGPTGPAPTPTSAPPPTVCCAPPSPTPSPSLLPAADLLTDSDVRPDFTGVGTPFPSPYVPNPFMCGPDGLPGAQPIVGAAGAGFTRTDVPLQLLGGESVLRFGPGGAQQTMAAIKQLLAGSCAGHFTPGGQIVAGDEALALQSTDGSVVVPEFAHGVSLSYAIVRDGDYLVWVTLVDQSSTSPPNFLAGKLAVRGSQRLCAAVAASSAC